MTSEPIGYPRTPYSPSSLKKIHAICETIRSNQYAGIDESKVRCEKCPALEDSPYGPGTRGCFLLAAECYWIAFGKTRPLT